MLANGAEHFWNAVGIREGADGTSIDGDTFVSPNRYYASASVALPGSGAEITDERVDMATLVVHGVRASGAVVDLPHSFNVERS